MKGFFNKLLRIDLESKSYSYTEIPDQTLRKTLGGKGLGVHLMLEEIPPGADPLSPENVFILATGPATGTRMWGQARFGAYTKSPATEGFGESYCGGTLPPKIKGCGVDAIVLTGRADTLQWLEITETGVVFHDAGEIRGAECFDAEEYILERSPDRASALVIGPAGENLVRFACIKSDRWRSLGRCGMGAVLGSKNVKGITFYGRKKADLANAKMLDELIRKISAEHAKSPVVANYRDYGTPMQVAVTNTLKCFPTRYWQKGQLEGWENLSAEYMKDNLETESTACPSCFLRCTKKSRIRKGKHAGLRLEGPEFETIYAIGGLNEVTELEEVAYLNDVCDRLGLDTMSAGNISAFAIEAFKAGKTDFEIDYNQPDRIAELYHDIAMCRGDGAVFAKGIQSASKELELEDIAVHVKGLEPAGFDPRVLKGMGLSYATSARGACHLRGTFYKAEISGEIDINQIKGKAKLLVDYEDRAALFDSMVLCRFFRDFIKWEELQTLIESTTGLSFAKDELEKIANRITNSTREFNSREGLDSSSDKLPKPFHRKNAEGAVLTHEELQIMMDEYNQLRNTCHE